MCKPKRRAAGLPLQPRGNTCNQLVFSWLIFQLVQCPQQQQQQQEDGQQGSAATHQALPQPQAYYA